MPYSNKIKKKILIKISESTKKINELRKLYRKLGDSRKTLFRLNNYNNYMNELEHDILVGHINKNVIYIINRKVILPPKD